MAIDAKEKDLVHAKVRLIGRSNVTGDPKHNAFVQKYTVREYNQIDFATIGYELLEEINLPKEAKSKLGKPAEAKAKK
jgi:hypothetical protein